MLTQPTKICSYNRLKIKKQKVFHDNCQNQFRSPNAQIKKHGRKGAIRWKTRQGVAAMNCSQNVKSICPLVGSPYLESFWPPLKVRYLEMLKHRLRARKKRRKITCFKIVQHQSEISWKGLERPSLRVTQSEDYKRQFNIDRSFFSEYLHRTIGLKAQTFRRVFLDLDCHLLF